MTRSIREVRGRSKRPTLRTHSLFCTPFAVLAALACVGWMSTTTAGAAPAHSPRLTRASVAAMVVHRTPRNGFVAGAASHAAPAASGAHDVTPNCTFNGAPDIVVNVTPGSSIAVSCTGWPANDAIVAGQFSPLLFVTGSDNEIDPNLQYFTSDANGSLDATFVVPNPFSAPDPTAVCPPTPAQIAQGLLACGIAFADTAGNGTAALLLYAGQQLPSPSAAAAVGIASTPDGGGYWIAWSDGVVTFHGDAGPYGDASGLNLAQPITHIVATADGRGYWLVAADGGTFAFGDAGFYGSMGGRPLNQPVVDIAPTADDGGYWLVAADGGIFAFGDAGFAGSMGGVALNAPVVGIAADHSGHGYWEVATDGGIFAFGDAGFYGSTGSLALNRPINGMAPAPNGAGYWLVASDGGVFAFGDAGFYGSTGSLVLNSPIMGMAADPSGTGYWMVGGDGGVFAFGTAGFYGAG